jgi:ParB-like chromosome segregation protein Spo0J
MTQKQFKIKSIQPISVNELQPSPELMEVQSFLPISAEDRERLKRDIEKSGEIRDPIKIYYDNDGNPMILGGFNRWHIAQELGWEFVPCEVMNVDPKERRELAIMDNLARRHMTREQKQKIVEMFLKNDPVQSDRTIAKKTGADHKTVGTVRSKLEATGEIPQLEKRAGADGKIRKAEPERPAKSVKNRRAIFNAILDAVDDMDSIDLHKLAVLSAEESLKRLKEPERKKTVDELKKVLKKYQ